MVLQEIVISNLKVTNERLERLSGEVSYIKESQELTQKQLEDETKMIKKDNEILQKNLNKIEKDLLDPEIIENKLIELEDRSRRNNLRTDGIAEINNNYWTNCVKQFLKIIREKSKIEKNIELDRCHRAGKKQNNRSRATVLEPFYVAVLHTYIHIYIYIYIYIYINKIFAVIRWN